VLRYDVEVPLRVEEGEGVGEKEEELVRVER